MRAVVIGAGRGSRLGPHTESIPKTLVPVMGRPMLDWILEALEGAGFARAEIVFICGYAEDIVRARYPELTYVRNADWENNNILLSLLAARSYLKEGFLSTYSDIVYDPELVKNLVSNPGPIVLGCDTAWRRRYVDRSHHPESDAEKLVAAGRHVVQISRHVPSDRASGEFVGLMKLDRQGTQEFLQAFDEVQARFPTGVFREGRTLARAYLIDLLAHMIENGSVMLHEDTCGGYMEIDTVEDLSHAQAWWDGRVR